MIEMEPRALYSRAMEVVAVQLPNRIQAIGDSGRLFQRVGFSQSKRSIPDQDKTLDLIPNIAKQTNKWNRFIIMKIGK